MYKEEKDERKKTMPSTFFGLTIGTSGLYAYQAALNTTSHNISNADTVGYSRQQAIQQASKAISVSSSYGMAGTGVDVIAIKQIRNIYYDMKYWSNNTLYGEYSTKEYYMTAIEDYIKENDKNGLTATFNDFYNSLIDLSKDVSNETIRTQVTKYASSFTSFVNYLANSLQSIQTECNTEIKNTVERINSLAEQIASVNKQINTIEVSGNKANDLRDKRALLIDELSQLASVSVNESSVPGGTGITDYIVRLDGKILVDGYSYNQLRCIPQEIKNNQNDITGLYDIEWTNGQAFNPQSPTLGGTLKALFEVRDGNNLESFKGTAAGTSGSNTLTITNSNIKNMNKLNIPDTGGMIQVGNQLFEYSSFTAALQVDGTYTYTFNLKNNLSADVNGTATIGKNVDYKGVPYYQAQLNEFVRTFSASFNELHKLAEDLNGDKGLDFFNGTDKTSGINFTLSENAATITSTTSLVAGVVNASYYNLTALNFTVTEQVLSDPKKMACAEKRINGVEDKVYLEKLIAIKSNASLFKQGTPDSFLQTLTGEIGIDGKKAQTFAKSQNNILKAIDNQRMSISGVDTDEEAMNLVKFQNAYNLSAKVISVMNEIYDKLINQMGV